MATLIQGNIKMKTQLSNVISKLIKVTVGILLVMACLAVSGCSTNVGVGLSVGVPVGNHGYISVGTGRGWY